jgi:hypothetical protein
MQELQVSNRIFTLFFEPLPFPRRGEACIEEAQNEVPAVERGAEVEALLCALDHNIQG